MKSFKPSNDLTTLAPTVRQSLIFTNDQLIPFIICLVGALIQVTDLLAIYFSFQTTTQINFYSPTLISLPAVSLCYEYDLNLDKVQQKFSRFNSTSEIDLSDLRFNLTLGELGQVTAEAEQFVPICNVINSSSSTPNFINRVDCYKVSPVKVNINAQKKCFTFFSGDKSAFQYQKNIFYDEYFLIILIDITITSNSYFQIVIHDSDTKVDLNNGSPEMITMDGKHFNNFVFTYYTEQMLGLEWPFSDCLLYHLKTGRSKHDTIENCIFNSVYNDYKAFDDQILVPIPFVYDNVSFVKGIRAARYRSQCESQYNKPECRTKSYQLELLRSLNNSDPDSFLNPGMLQIQFVYPIGSQIDVTLQPKQDTDEYFCYIASIINLWLEISVLGVVQFIFRNMRKIITRYLAK